MQLRVLQEQGPAARDDAVLAARQLVIAESQELIGHIADGHRDGAGLAHQGQYLLLGQAVGGMHLAIGPGRVDAVADDQQRLAMPRVVRDVDLHAMPPGRRLHQALGRPVLRVQGEPALLHARELP
ncbi:hypothetical protein D3C71_1510180 [compost metagenome]